MFYLRLHHVFTQNHCVKTTQTRVHTATHSQWHIAMITLPGMILLASLGAIRRSLCRSG